MSSSITPPPSSPPVPGEPEGLRAAAATAPLAWDDADMLPPLPDAGATTGPLPTGSEQNLPTIGHIGRYALKYKMGVGGLGTVYAAYDPLLSRLIAVKTLNLEVDETERAAFNAVFINEARAAGGLSHPHIVTVFDAGISDKRAYIAMELLKGRDLRKLRQEGWRATPAQAALIVRRVADALAFAHSKGVIHRDIKPANIFMVGRTQPRVLDFGIARVTHQHGSADLHSGAGSPYYMAPEQIRREPADRRADVFSLGVVLYELLTDTRPFRGETLKDIVAAVLTFDPPLASKLDPSVPKDLAQIVERAMAKDPEHRYRSARSFARELRQWLDDNPSNVEAEGTTTRPAGVPRRRGLVVALAAATATLVGGAVLAWQLFGPPSRAASERAAPAATAATAAIAPRSAATTAIPTTVVAAESPSASTSALPASSAAASLAVVIATPSATQIVDAAAAGATALPPTSTPSTTPILASSIPVPTVTPTVGSLPVVPAPARESAKDRRQREAGEREVRERAMRAAAVAANLPVGANTFGTLKVAVSPWGEIEVDGNAAGAAPPLTELRLAEGRHQIVIRNGDFAPYVANVAVAAGQVVSLHYKFGS